MTGYQSKRAAAQDKLEQWDNEALKLALEALENGKRVRDGEGGTKYQPWLEDAAITAIKEALAQPAQEPVAMLERDPSIGRLRVTYEDAVTELDEGVYPLYTKPQGWRDNVAQAYLKGFDEGCKSISVRNGDTTGRWSGKTENASKPIAWLEPEWGEKICPEVGYEVTMTDDHPRDLGWIPLYPHPPQGEIVAYLVLFEGAGKLLEFTKGNYIHGAKVTHMPLYTAPPQRTWVGLTRDEVLGIEEITKHPLDFYRAIEAKLKEKNNG